MTLGIVRPSEELQTRLRTLREFREQFRDTLAFADALRGPLGRGFFGPPEGREGEFDARLDRLAEMAGRARRAAGSDNISMVQLGFTTEPLLQWRDVFSYDGTHSVSDVLDALNTTIGILEDRLAEARRAERTLAFRLGWLLGFPSRVRQVAGPGRGAQRVAFWAAVASQVIAGLIVVAIPFVVARLV